MKRRSSEEIVEQLVQRASEIQGTLMVSMIHRALAGNDVRSPDEVEAIQQEGGFLADLFAMSLPEEDVETLMRSGFSVLADGWSDDRQRFLDEGDMHGLRGLVSLHTAFVIMHGFEEGRDSVADLATTTRGRGRLKGELIARGAVPNAEQRVLQITGKVPHVISGRAAPKRRKAPMGRTH